MAGKNLNPSGRESESCHCLQTGKGMLQSELGAMKYGLGMHERLQEACIIA
jgi:hypothetical protein